MYYHGRQKSGGVGTKYFWPFCLKKINCCRWILCKLANLITLAQNSNQSGVHPVFRYIDDAVPAVTTGGPPNTTCGNQVSTIDAKHCYKSLFIKIYQAFFKKIKLTLCVSSPHWDEHVVCWNVRSKSISSVQKLNKLNHPGRAIIEQTISLKSEKRAGKI